jgi:hypothetical protein
MNATIREPALSDTIGEQQRTDLSFYSVITGDRSDSGRTLMMSEMSISSASPMNPDAQAEESAVASAVRNPFEWSVPARVEKGCFERRAAASRVRQRCD